MQTECIGFYPNDDYQSLVCSHFISPNKCQFFIDGECSYCEGVTTISKESTQNNVEAHSSEASDGDIVCSV